MAYDAARGVTVLFGGTWNMSYLGDTWEWNGTAWRLRTVFGPSGRLGHAMAYDAARGVTVLFGGSTGRGPGGLPYVNGETWEWDGTVWTELVVTGPSPREFAAMAYDAARGVTVLFGGIAGFIINSETWVLGAPCPADFDHSGAVNSQDFFDFLTAFFALDLAADFNHSGTVDAQDYFDFVAAFFAGCG
jgi:hypothetical protein